MPRDTVINKRALLFQKPLTASWTTPAEIYGALHAEFIFDYDPCPLGAWGGLFGTHDGLLASWRGRRVFCNPPYGPGIAEWLARWHEPDMVAYLLPARTDSAWWHRYAPFATQIRFVRGRLKFGRAGNTAPFPSVILIYQSAAEVPSHA